MVFVGKRQQKGGLVMLVLGFDTSTSVGSVALSQSNNLICENNLEIERTHMERLFPAIDSLLRSNGFSITDVDGVAVGLGPGSFTGTRIGVTVARGLIQALNKSLVGISSLDILAYGLFSDERRICAIIDARRGEVYTAFYKFSNGRLERLSLYRTVSPEELSVEVGDCEEKTVLVGNALAVYGDIFKKYTKMVDFAPSELWFPKASNLIKLTLPRFLMSQTDDVFQLSPLYVRPPDAEQAYNRKGK
jgi:tRNA threonylcarbamoyladenosine biosynthesis protein TsaB